MERERGGRNRGERETELTVTQLLGAASRPPAAAPERQRQRDRWRERERRGETEERERDCTYCDTASGCCFTACSSCTRERERQRQMERERRRNRGERERDRWRERQRDRWRERETGLTVTQLLGAASRLPAAAAPGPSLSRLIAGLPSSSPPDTGSAAAHCPCNTR